MEFLTLLQKQKELSVTEAQDFIKKTQDKFLFNADVAAYLTGYRLIDGALVRDTDARDHTQGVMPKLSGLTLFPEIMFKLSLYAPAYLETKNKKDDKKVNDLAEPLYDKQDIPAALWREVEINYFMASNEVIYTEFIRDYGRFLASIEEVRKYIMQKCNQDKRVKDFYFDIFKDYDHKTEWFDFVMDDLTQLAKGFKKTPEFFPPDLTEWRTLFWNAHKEQRKVARELISERDGKKANS